MMRRLRRGGILVGLATVLGCGGEEAKGEGGERAADSLAAAPAAPASTGLPTLPRPAPGHVVVVMDPRLPEGSRGRIAQVVSLADEQPPRDTMQFAALRDARFNLVLAVDSSGQPLYLASLPSGGAAYLGVSSTVRGLALSLLRQRAEEQAMPLERLLVLEGQVHQHPQYTPLVQQAGEVDRRGERVLESAEVARGAQQLVEALLGEEAP